MFFFLFGSVDREHVHGYAGNTFCSAMRVRKLIRFFTRNVASESGAENISEPRSAKSNEREAINGLEVNENSDELIVWRNCKRSFS